MVFPMDMLSLLWSVVHIHVAVTLTGGTNLYWVTDNQEKCEILGFLRG